MGDRKLAQVILDPEKDCGNVRGSKVSKQSAEAASQLLTENHQKMHAYFHMAGMHSWLLRFSAHITKD